MKMRILLTGVALVTMLAACDRTAETSAPVDTAAATLPLTAEEQLAPSVDALPEAPPAPLAQAPAANYDEDAYWDEASRADDYYDDRAPDYAFDYGEEEPAAWVDGGDILRLVERLVGGGERYYYYRRGEDRPYYVRDPDYAYGYDRGQLVTVYDARTRRALAREDARQRSEQAGRYLARSQELRRAAARTDAQDRRQLDRAQYRQWRQREDIRERQDQAQAQQRAREIAERDRAGQERDRVERDRDRDRLDRDRIDRDRSERDRDRGDRDRDRDRSDRDRDGRDRPPVAAPPAVATPAPKPAPAPVFKPTPQAQRPDGGRIFDDRKGPDRVQPRPAPAVRPVAKPAPAPVAKPAPAPKPVVKPPAAPVAKPAPVAVAKPAPKPPVAKPAVVKPAAPVAAAKPAPKPKPKPGKDMTPAERKAAREALQARMKGTPQKQEQ